MRYVYRIALLALCACKATTTFYDYPQNSPGPGIVRGGGGGTAGDVMQDVTGTVALPTQHIADSTQVWSVFLLGVPFATADTITSGAFPSRVGADPAERPTVFCYLRPPSPSNVFTSISSVPVPATPYCFVYFQQGVWRMLVANASWGSRIYAVTIYSRPGPPGTP